MNLSIKQRLLALTTLPIILISFSMLGLSYNQSINLNHQQTEQAHTRMIAIKKAELMSYLDLALSSLKPLKERNATQTEVIDTLKTLKYGSIGYFVGYDSKGTRLFAGTSTKGLGETFWNSQDSKGNFFIQELIQKAKNNSKEFTTYYFTKPGSEKSQPKLSYSIYVPQWDLIISSGFYTDDINKIINEMDLQSNENLNESILHTILICLLVAAVVALFGYFVNRSVMRPLNLFSDAIAHFAKGDADLKARIEDFSIPEYKKLGNNFNLFVANLHQMISLVQQVSGHVSYETAQMASRASSVNDLTIEQHEETDQVATAMTEMTTTAQEISKNASEAENAAQTAEGHSKHALQTVASAVTAVEELATEIESAATVIANLENDVKNISSALGVIQSIAEQTNLLALNAAIEAARAGEQGRGFAVVADEVRQLASRTQQSTGDIHGMIEQLIAASDAAVKVMSSSKQKGGETVQEATAASEALDLIRQSIATIMEMNSLIATATEEQSIVGAEISERVVIISDKSEQSAGFASKNQKAAKTLQKHATELDDLVSKFTL